MKKIIIIILVVAAAAVVIWYWYSSGGYAPTGETVTPAPEAAPGAVPEAVLPDDTTAVIDEELQGIDLGDLNQEFQSIDADLNSL